MEFFHFLDLMRRGVIIGATETFRLFLKNAVLLFLQDRKDIRSMTPSDERVNRITGYRPFSAVQPGWTEMQNRISHRRYLPTPLTDEERTAIERLIEHFNRRTGLHISLFCDRGDVFTGHLSTARNFLLLAGPAGDQHLEEKCGYFGQLIVLSATALGLATCWVGGTYDRGSCLAHLSKGERLVCVIAIGHAASTAAHHTPHRSTKSIQQLTTTTGDTPPWFSDALTAVQLAPSAMNRQDVSFTLQAENRASAHITDSESFSMVDLGIAKLHFELGAHGGDWEWGDGGVFHRAIQEKSCGAVVHRERSGVREYLIIRHNGGHWSFPKGHMESGENEVQTATREILEETGLHTEIDTAFRSIVTYSPKNGVMKDVVFFLASVIGGTEHAQEEEIAQLEWLTFEQARATVTFPTDTGVLEAADEFLQKKA